METIKRKKQLIQLFESGNYSLHEISRRLEVDRGAIKTWLAIYQYHGIEALLYPPCTPYAESFKMKVIEYTVETADAMFEIAGKFNIPSRATIWKWMKKYMSEADWSLYYLKRERRDQMRKEKPTQLSELEKLKRENELLKAEIEYLKKLKALIQEKEKK